MKSIVIYYSQTGNSRAIARSICRGIEAETGQCDISRIQDLQPDGLQDYDLIGIGSPIWGSCPPLNVIYFINDMPGSMAGKHAFYFCTHGATPGRGVLRGIQPMKEKGLVVLGWNDWYGAAKVPRHLKPWFTDGHPDEIDLQQAEAFGTAMAIHSRKYAEGDAGILPQELTPEISDYLYGAGHPFLFPQPPEGAEPPQPPADLDQYPRLRYPTSMAYTMALEGIPGTDLNVKADGAIDATKCIGCGRCAEACFCGNIDASTTPPTFRNPYCEHCFFCEGVCPTGAISFDFSLPVSDEEEDNQGGLQGYIQILNHSEAIGRFRRLVKDEDIGWDTPWEMVSGHPRIEEIP